VSDCPNCARLQARVNALETTLEERDEILGELSMDNEGFEREIAAHTEVQVMSRRGFTLLTSEVGRDVWARGAQRVPVTSLFCRSVMQDVNDACAKPEVPGV
jgi:hypothetical protein